jgi:hypothetical protein
MKQPPHCLSVDERHQREELPGPFRKSGEGEENGKCSKATDNR